MAEQNQQETTPGQQQPVEAQPDSQAPVQYAGFWIRLLATLLDTVILLLVSFALLAWLYGTGFLFDQQVSSKPGSIIINYVLPIMATILFWRYRSATPGKMMMGISIVDAKTLGQPCTLNLWIRYFGYLVSMIPLFLGFIWVAFDARKQGFHDKLSDTLVIVNNPASEQR